METLGRQKMWKTMFFGESGFLDMKIISHRGNVSGRKPRLENTKEYVLKALKSFDVEIDVWAYDGAIYLGHDEPTELIPLTLLKLNSEKLWIHCKNIEALETLSKERDLNCFGHSLDEFVLTSKGFIFTKPNSNQSPNSVSVDLNAEKLYYKNYGVCTDYPEKYRNK